MSGKKKINNADFVAATKVVRKYRECLAVDAGSFIDMMGVFFVCGETLDIFKPFDMIANGASIGGVSDDVWGDYFNEWLCFISLFEKGNGHDNLYTSFVMMCGMIARRLRGFSQAAFMGVYGNFRVALANCLKSKDVRFRGGKTLEEKIEMLALGVSNSQRMAEVARVLSKGEKTREDYIKLQYVEFKREYMDCIDDDIEKPVILGSGGVMCSTWRKTKIDGVIIPKDGGMVAEDWETPSRLYYKWMRNLKREGIYKGRKNKPGAGGARVRSKLRRTA